MHSIIISIDEKTGDVKIDTVGLSKSKIIIQHEGKIVKHKLEMSRILQKFMGVGFYEVKIKPPGFFRHYIDSFVFYVFKSFGCYRATKAMSKDVFDYCTSVHGFLKPEEGIVLYDEALSLPRQSTVVEIGAYCGRSSCFLAAALRENGGKLYSIDTFENDSMSEGKRSTYEEFKNNTKPFDDIIVPVRSSSVNALGFIQEQIDMLFIDGDHSLRGCAEDLGNYYRKIKKEGVVCFHDCVNSSEYKRVKTVVSYFANCGLLTPLYMSKSVAVATTSKSINVGIRTGEGSVNGALQLHNYLYSSESFNSFLCDYVSDLTVVDSLLTLIPKKLEKTTLLEGWSYLSKSYSKIDAHYLRVAAFKASDIILAHNVVNTKSCFNFREKTVLYALQGAYNKIKEDPELHDSLSKNPYLAILTNSKTLHGCFGELGLSSSCFYRPSVTFTYPDRPLELPDDKNVALYFAISHPPMFQYAPLVKKLVSRLSMINFYIVNKGDDLTKQEVNSWGLSNVKYLGMVDIKELCRNVKGVVRISDPLDLGRSTFDFISYGRFYASLKTCEDFGYTSESIEGLADVIYNAVEGFGNEDAILLHAQAKNFSFDERKSEFNELLLSLYKSDIGTVCVE
ncbi:class I SAM-dependent methyltransferase [Halomonas sp. M5N1S17]|uniref:class I SAM-dependent methyltransferase n=1 Tax=Halomonas alkalisoli TaxID=2907158 RepID=UPI001F1E78C2|nr:class I SAM-dependent methyltransferase [Halomonas alkalisoli]MCE9662539.1 class I SAM-dependent methyltransferase [Halomonas alkalisoli]